MLFNSYEYLFVFLPAVVVVYFLLNRFGRSNLAKTFLLVASIFFYSHSNIVHLLRLILLSMICNYWIGKRLAKEPKKIVLLFGVGINVLSLMYFKYADFFIENVNALFSTSLPLLHIALPLGISFFTFQEIAYLVDSYYGKTKEYNFKNYALFVTFFPQLIAGPIVHHSEMMPQFDNKEHQRVNYENIARGLFLLGIGLFKKVVIADTLARTATDGFTHPDSLSFFGAWGTSLSYTLQLYFDFSGYSDMAIGAALLFNIVLPANFNSPYKASTIQEFWRRWHMTLSRFFKAYVYIPLGGNTRGLVRTCTNLLAVFLIGGIWHGAGWTFVVWGALHGCAMAVQYLWKQLHRPLPAIIGWFLTFQFVNASWVFFRAKSLSDAVHILKTMTHFSDMRAIPMFYSFLRDTGQEYGMPFYRAMFRFWVESPAFTATVYIIASLLIVLLFKNSFAWLSRFKANAAYAMLLSAMLFAALYSLDSYSEFIYFNF